MAPQTTIEEEALLGEDIVAREKAGGVEEALPTQSLPP